MADFLFQQTMFATPIILFGALATCLAAWWFIRRISLERPPIGVFNGRDIGVLFVFIITLPALYLLLPQWALTAFLIVTFTAALAIGYRPALPRAVLWPAIGALVGVNIWLTRTMLGTIAGWQLMLVINSFMVLLAAVAVANLYVQGGMRFKHVALFALTLGIYDVLFLPFTLLLADAFIGKPLNPSIGMRMSVYNVAIGLGDLLVYALFTIAALKAYGRRAAAIALSVVGVFGAIVPAFAPLIITEVTRGTGNVVAPAQVMFGPAAFVTWLVFRHRYGRERTWLEFQAAPDGPVRANIPTSPATPPAPRTEAGTATPVTAGTGSAG